MNETLSQLRLVQLVATSINVCAGVREVLEDQPQH